MPKTNIKKGSILISRPSLTLDIFSRSVVLIVDHTDNGTIGFIINKSTEIPINVFVEDIDITEVVYEGGPVDKDNIFYLHRRPDLIENSYQISEGIYWSGDFDDVNNAIKYNLFNKNDIKFFLGYSGWSKNQLFEEIEERKEWEIINNIPIDLFTCNTNEIWKNLMKKLGGENLIWSNTPFDPSMN